MRKIVVGSLVSLFVLSCSVPVTNTSTQDTSSSLIGRLQYAPTGQTSLVLDTYSPSPQTPLLGGAGVGSLHPSLVQDNFSDLEKEYKSFSTNALSDGYVKRMFNKYISESNSIQLTRQLEFARYLKTQNDTTYETSLKSMFTDSNSLYTDLREIPEITTKITNESATFGTFIDGLSPIIPIPTGIFSDSITASAFTAHWDTLPGVTFEIVIDNNSPVNTGTSTTYVATGLTGLNHTFKVRAIKSNVPGSYSSVNNVTLFPDNVIFVKANATGMDNGTNWVNAYNSLQSALTSATNGKDIWIASGTYKPGSNVSSTFQLKNGVRIYGGFSGTETEVSQRNFNTNIVILSGDINNSNTQNNGDCYHVVTGATGATIDGVSIKFGYANSDSSPDFDGAGMLNISSSPTVNNVIFSHNHAKNNGGAINNTTSSPVITNSTFTFNSSIQSGGAVYSSGTSIPEFTNVTFSNNSSNNGGGMSNETSANSRFTNVKFLANSAPYGGAIYNYSSSPTLNNVAFLGNSSSTMGGGMYNRFATVDLKNCIFYDNVSSNTGGAVYNTSSSLTITNSTFSNNTANFGPGFYNYTSSVVVAKNCIFWGSSTYNYTTGYLKLGYSLLQGNFSSVNANIQDLNGVPITSSSGFASAGNIYSGTLFVNSSDPDGADNTIMTSDDGLALQNGSNCRNTGSNSGAPSTDIIGTSRPRPVGGNVDMGAYEYVE